MTAAIHLLQDEIEALRFRRNDTPSAAEAQALDVALVELGDALDLLRGAQC